MHPLLFLLPVAAVTWLWSRRASAQGTTGLCRSNPPGAQPVAPAGWALYRGDVSMTARSQARQALAQPLGTWLTFQDDGGETVGILLQYHCHEPEENVRPVGWHKGATLFRKVA
jgi:hypothetical protein